jgi:small subunit ribosomal protein S5
MGFNNMAGAVKKSNKADNQSDTNSESGSDLVEMLVSIRRVSKVVKGGRRFGFSALVIVGDGKGRVGYGTGSSIEVVQAKEKATNDAKNNFIRVQLREGRTFHHDVIGNFGAGKISLRSAPAGTGIIAGGPLRAVFECLGVKDVVAKSIGTQNAHNMVKACFNAFEKLTSPRSIAEKRGKKIGDIVGRRESNSKGSEDDKAE